jgi:hypothetical protein
LSTGTNGVSKKVRRVVISVRVRAAHEAVADDADVEGFLLHEKTVR